MNTIQERKEALLSKSISEVSLAIEGRYTNLRIFIGHDGNGPVPVDTVFMRLDKYQNYSAPLDEKTIKYLDKSNPVIERLLKEFGFKSGINNLDTILEITKDMVYRSCLSW